MFSHVFINSIPWNSVLVQILLDISVQGPRSNFGGGGGTSVTRYWGATTHFLLLTLKNCKILGGTCHPAPPCSAVPAVQSCSKISPKAKSCSRLLKSKSAEHNLFSRPILVECPTGTLSVQPVMNSWSNLWEINKNQI